jgi:hypothetical protein
MKWCGSGKNGAAESSLRLPILRLALADHERRIESTRDDRIQVVATGAANMRRDLFRIFVAPHRAVFVEVRRSSLVPAAKTPSLCVFTN